MFAELLKTNADLTGEVARLKAAMAALEADKKRLEGRVEWLVRQLFGHRSERFENPLQNDLFEDVEQLSAEAKAEIEQELASSEEPKRKRSRRNGRKPLPKDLPRERIVLDLSEAEKICPHGVVSKLFGQDVTQELDMIPAQLLVREYVRLKYKTPDCTHPECQGIKMAPLPARPIEQGRPAPGMLAHIAVSKYCDHLPLYRQEKMFARHGIELARSTMSDWMLAAGSLLSGIVNEMKRSMAAGSYLQADETPIRVQGLKKGKMHKAYLWGYGVPWGEVVYEFSLDRSHRNPMKFLDAFEGLLQVDGYKGYDALVRAKQGRVTRLGCWAHVRRKVFDALKTSPREANIVLAAIQKLYRIEAAIRGQPPPERAALRREKARPILQSLKPLLEAYAEEFLPESPLGSAIRYALGEWPYLERYVEFGEAEIDNNAIEHTIRPIALGRKNFLFLGSTEGGRAAAVLYSLITSCQRLGVNPWAYLKDVIDRISTHPAARVRELTPRGWRDLQAEDAAEPVVVEATQA